MTKIKQTTRQRANTIEALEVMWPSVPPENVCEGLKWWRKGKPTRRPPTCETVACFGGWCAWWPAFKAQGVQANEFGAPCITNARDVCYQASAVFIKLFGDYDICAPVGNFECEMDFKGTDHELVTHRLKRLLENSEVVE